MWVWVWVWVGGWGAGREDGGVGADLCWCRCGCVQEGRRRVTQALLRMHHIALARVRGCERGCGAASHLEVSINTQGQGVSSGGISVQWKVWVPA